MQEYGLDLNCYYPYISGLRIKSEFQGMVDINDEIKKAFCSEDYVHWDSTDSDSDDDEITCNAALNPCEKKKRVPSLSALTLKTIFSNRLLGKVPRKRRKVKPEKVFDSILTNEEQVRMDINSIIDNLGDDDFDKNDEDSDRYQNNYLRDSKKSDSNENQDDSSKRCLNDSNEMDIDSSIDNCFDKDMNSGDYVDNNLSYIGAKITNDTDNIVNNCVNDSDDNDKTDTVRSIGDLNAVNDVVINFNVNNDINSAKDNFTDSIDKKSHINENNDNRTEHSESNDNCANDSLLNKEDNLLETNSMESELLESNSVMDENDIDSKSSITNYTDNSNLESRMNNNHQNSDSDQLTNNDNDSIDDAMITDEFEKRNNESYNINRLNENDNSTNKVINDIDDLINNGTEMRVGLSNIDDFNFDS